MHEDYLPAGGVFLELRREALYWYAEYPAMARRDAAASARGGVILGVIFEEEVDLLL